MVQGIDRLIAVVVPSEKPDRLLGNGEETQNFVE